MRLFDCLCGLFRPGSGRRRVHANHQTALARVAELELQLAPLAGLTEVRCGLGADHPVWWTAETPGDCPWCLAQTFAIEAKELRFLLGAGAEGGGIDMAAAADTDGSCFTQPDPAPLPDFRISDIAPGPVGSEAADVNTRTQPVDMRALRADMAATATQSRPVLPGELARSEAMTVSTPVMTLTERGGLVKFSKPKTSLIRVAPVAGERAHESVEAAVGAAP